MRMIRQSFGAAAACPLEMGRHGPGPGPRRLRWRWRWTMKWTWQRGQQPEGTPSTGDGGRCETRPAPWTASTLPDQPTSQRDAVRLADQASFGATEALIKRDPRQGRGQVDLRPRWPRPSRATRAAWARRCTSGPVRAPASATAAARTAAATGSPALPCSGTSTATRWRSPTSCASASRLRCSRSWWSRDSSSRAPTAFATTTTCCWTRPSATTAAC